MSDIDVAFCRSLLAQIAPEVKAIRPSINVWFGKDAWVIATGRQGWEFHGPDGFFWQGRAANAYDARYKGWSGWLAAQQRASGSSEEAIEGAAIAVLHRASLDLMDPPAAKAQEKAKRSERAQGGRMTAILVVHYKVEARHTRGACGRDLLGARWTDNPGAVTCVMCGKHPAVIASRAGGLAPDRNELEHVATLIAIESPEELKRVFTYIPSALVERIRNELDRRGIDWRAMASTARCEHERRSRRLNGMRGGKVSA
jgi:hypothetical protein